MSGTGVAEALYAAIEESAQLVGAPSSRDGIEPILSAYGDALTEAGLVVSVSTDEHPPAELDYTLTVPAAAGDPLAIALANGFVGPTDHPVGALLPDIQARATISEHLIDCGSVSGFSKIYAHFPFHPLGVPELAAIASMPPAVAENADLFARHHLDHVAMIGIDYKRRSVNLYFAQITDEFRQASNILSLQRALGLPEPQDRMLDFALKSFRSTSPSTGTPRRSNGSASPTRRSATGTRRRFRSRSSPRSRSSYRTRSAPTPASPSSSPPPSGLPKASTSTSGRTAASRP